jgi:two-component system cell cycle sensor histidine kinase/response regulator CckA
MEDPGLRNASMPAVTRTESGALLLPRPERRRFSLREVPRPPGEEAAAATPSPGPPVPGPSQLEQLGRMTASVAHDFNNILSVIMVCASEIAADAVDPQQLERATEITEAAERGAQLSRRLLSDERISEPEAEEIAIDVAIVDALPLLRRTLSATAEITLSSDGHLPRVRLAPGELERMLVNLAANSRDAMTADGRVAIRTALVPIPPGDPCLGPGLCVRISFSDNGAGMTLDVARQAIRPHFTTKRASGGSGLGLATVHSLIRARGGDLRINTAPGSGATISLYLPAVNEAGEALALDPPRA